MEYTEEEKTNAVLACNSFEELEKVVEKYQPFISNSRDIEIYHENPVLQEKINAARNGNLITYVTRQNGLRAKVIELMKK